MKLYELCNAIEAFDFDIDEETGEILNAAELDALELERDERIENVALWIKNLRAEAAAYKSEKDVFAKRQKQAENKADSLERYIDQILGGEKFKTDRVAITYRKSQAIQIDDGAVIPPEYLISVEPKIDKVGLKKAIKDAGAEFEGIRLEERNSMSIK